MAMPQRCWRWIKVENVTSRLFVLAVSLLLAGCAVDSPLVIVPPTDTPSNTTPRTSELTMPPPGLPNGVAAGDVTQESMVLWARAAETGTVPLWSRQPQVSPWASH